MSNGTAEALALALNSAVEYTVDPIPVGGIDLIIEDYGWKLLAGAYKTFSDHPVEGDRVYFWMTITNQGDVATPAGIPTDMAFQISGPGVGIVCWNDTYTTSIAPGASVTLVTEYGDAAVGYVDNIPEGTFDAHMILNSGPVGVGRFEETDFANNLGDDTFSVNPAPGGGGGGGIGEPTLPANVAVGVPAYRIIGWG